MLKKRFLSIALLAVFMIGGLSVGSTPVLSAEKGVVVMDAWSRARPEAAKVGGAFLMIHNMGDTKDRLIEVRSPVAERVEIHETIKKGGMMSMAAVEEIHVPASAKVMLKPGGHHIMLMGLKENMTKGHKFPMTLVFENAGEIEVIVDVKEAGAMPKGHKMN